MTDDLKALEALIGKIDHLLMGQSQSAVHTVLIVLICKHLSYMKDQRLRLDAMKDLVARSLTTDDLIAADLEMMKRNMQ
jgi:hypothetical protein